MFKFMTKLRKDEDGATAIEYGLIAALVAIALIGGLNALGGSLDTMFNDVSTTLDENSPAGEEEEAPEVP